jgi:hypothetical protein
MKTQRARMLGALVITLASGAQAMAGGSGRIPFPDGHFSFAAQGTEASCQGSSCAVLNIIESGASIRDGAGNACGTHMAVVNTVPPTAAPPIVVPVTHVLKVIHYDPNTGTGDMSLNEYSGGTCHGAIFNGTGATQVVTGTLHFATSNGGKRIDSIVTALSLTGGGPGGYSIRFTELQQDSSGDEH